jgi:ABC-type thiamine transport system substrate-binding protein
MVNNQKLENNCIDYDDLVKGIMNLTLKKVKEKELFYTFLLSRTAIERMVQFDFAYTAYEYLSEKKIG